MRIEARLDAGSTPDPVEPAGAIRIGGDEHGCIEVRSAWLDDWLTALVEAARGAEAGVERQELELLSEAEPLYVELADDGVFLAFGGGTARFNTADDLRRELAAAIRAVVESFGARARLEQLAEWSALASFARRAT